MAWSDAARAAALEARRMHARAWKEVERWPITTTPGSSSYWRSQVRPMSRKILAGKLRDIRKGGTGYRGGAMTPYDVMYRAVSSTRARNQMGGAALLKKR